MNDVEMRKRLRRVVILLILLFLAFAFCLWWLLWAMGLNTLVNIWSAVDREDLNAIQHYADRGGNMEVGSWLWAETPLLYALKLGKKKSYQKLLEVGANPNTLCRGGHVVTYYAAGDKDSY